MTCYACIDARMLGFKRCAYHAAKRKAEKQRYREAHPEAVRGIKRRARQKRTAEARQLRAMLPPSAPPDPRGLKIRRKAERLGYCPECADRRDVGLGKCKACAP